MRSLSCLPPIITFNSLSRDHRKSETRQSIHQRKPATFNSLSRDHKVAKPVSGSTSHPFHFQLPLSGSPRADQAASLLPIIITFNSLSRDHRQPIPPGSSLLPVITFNSLSRDHRARFRDFSALRGFLPRHPFAQMISKATIWIYLSASL